MSLPLMKSSGVPFVKFPPCCTGIDLEQFQNSEEDENIKCEKCSVYRNMSVVQDEQVDRDMNFLQAFAEQHSVHVLNNLPYLLKYGADYFDETGEKAVFLFTYESTFDMLHKPNGQIVPGSVLLKNFKTESEKYGIAELLNSCNCHEEIIYWLIIQIDETPVEYERMRNNKHPGGSKTNAELAVHQDISIFGLRAHLALKKLEKHRSGM